ncbi:MAG: helix-turn-helix domain-containing protein [Planctomycetes bacterium]|nr:helix-turn-helix domain-containing protein [Planctomycetota bacterium]
MSRRQIVTKPELARARRERRLPFVCTPKRLAKLLGVSKKTIYLWRAAGRFEGSYRKRGKYLLFQTDKALNAIFNDPEWQPITQTHPDR